MTWAMMTGLLAAQYVCLIVGLSASAVVAAWELEAQRRAEDYCCQSRALVVVVVQACTIATVCLVGLIVDIVRMPS